jgi:thiosulfate/3-mercaptopyruvate sulfurtransferase|tara:strand:+ start:1170 stop:2039 length:870 start_codon:yes stop_codon:yes gene_type:complete
MEYVRTDLLIDVNTLSQRLNDDNLRIFDTSVFLTPQQGGGYLVESGREKYQTAHIPGAGFIDLIKHWSNASSILNFTLPDEQRLGEVISEAGIGNSNEVILYSSGNLMWATRAWWLLHYAGHDNVKIVNGSFNAWRKAGLTTESGDKRYPESAFELATKHAVIANIEEIERGLNGKICTINALDQSLYEGSGGFYYTRRGHIPGSKPMSYSSLLCEQYFLPADDLEAHLNAQDALSSDRVITYCGGGIAATIDAFACKLMGQNNVAVYDGSMSEWVLDDSRPLTVGTEP